MLRARALEQAAQYRAIALDAIAAWQGQDDRADDKHRRGTSARTRAELRSRMLTVDAALLAVDPPPSGASSVDAPIYRQVYIVTHYPEGGLRGVHASQAGAEAEIAELCREYPDYTRQDFSIVCDRIRPSPPSGASPQATGGYIHHSLTDWIPTPGCDCDRCTSARKSAPKPTGGASPQAETRRDCTCLGTCRGAEGLGPRWKCALETPAPVSSVEPEPATTCHCLDCEPLTNPGPKPSEDDIDRLEKAAWDSKTDRVLVWYRDRAEMFRQRLRETERAWQLDRKKPTVEPEPCVWRDIDSAPKDGTEILVGSASLGPVVVKWKEGRSTMRDTDWMVSWDGDYLASEPYGWMPIPAPLKVER